MIQLRASMHFIAAVLLLCSSVAAIQGRMSCSVCVARTRVATYVSCSLFLHIAVNL